MYRKRWAGIAIAALAILSYGVFAQAGPAPGEESCGPGLPPGAPGFTEAEARKDTEMKANGFLRVCEADLARFDITFRRDDLSEARLAFQPLDLSHTPFARFGSLGINVETITNVRSRLYRGFRMPDGHTLTLSEHDMSADGTSRWRDPKDEPERINGLPARLTVWQASSGKAISHLSWVEGRRDVELWVNASVTQGPLREQLFALAASLPHSVPACPNEPQPLPVRLGPDGFPVHEPMPPVLTETQMQSIIDKAKQPCRVAPP